jgi:tetratricopeptide (TPR) repeat protein
MQELQNLITGAEIALQTKSYRAALNQLWTVVGSIDTEIAQADFPLLETLLQLTKQVSDLPEFEADEIIEGLIADFQNTSKNGTPSQNYKANKDFLERWTQFLWALYSLVVQLDDNGYSLGNEKPLVRAIIASVENDRTSFNAKVYALHSIDKGISTEEADRLRQSLNQLLTGKENDEKEAYKVAIELYTKGLYAESGELLEKILLDYPEGDYFNLAGAAQFMQNDFEQALAYYEQARNLQVYSPEVEGNIWEACNELWQQTKDDKWQDYYFQRYPAGKHIFE